MKEASFVSRVAPIDLPFPDFLQAVTLKLVSDEPLSNQLVIIIAKQDKYEKEMREIADMLDIPKKFYSFDHFLEQLTINNLVLLSGPKKYRVGSTL